MANRMSPVDLRFDQVVKRTGRIIQTLDAMRRQVERLLCRLTTQVGESDFDQDNAAISDVANKTASLTASIFLARTAIIREIHRDFPRSNLSVFETEGDPSDQQRNNRQEFRWVHKKQTND